MADINRVILVGRLTRDAELRYTNSGMAICKFGLAINKRRKVDDQWTDEAHFFDVVSFGRQGEAIAQYLLKGKQVGVDGELRQNRWEQDGQKRSKVEVAAFNIQLLGGRPGAGAETSDYGDFSGRPAGGSFTEGGGDYAKQPAQKNDDFEDDIPF